jgi:pimeloyl-ACP methyl ester carboxylesterase
MGYREIRDVEVWDGDVRTKVIVGGEGPPLLYLHAILGLQWDPFLDALAQHHTVYAPHLPGTVPGDPDVHKAIEDVWDLTLCYEEIVGALGLGSGPIAVVGHSFGGMLGAELAANNPSLVSKLVMLCPIGLWTDGRPFQNPMVLNMEELAGAAFADPTSPVAQMALALPEDPEALGEAIIAITWSMGVAAK